ncbi:MAG: hypothetical protein SFX18_18875 [Pirellulales bacterium]|nr:hypothetical protein [Pirellulales bacterium]
MAWSVWWVPLDPATATPPQLVRWLCTHLAVEQPTNWQESLYLRCEREVLSPDSSIDWQELAAALQALTPAQKKCWTENLDWLGGTWFRREGAEYLALPAQEKGANLRQQISGWCDCELKYLTKVYQISQPAQPSVPPAEPSPASNKRAGLSFPLASLEKSPPAGPPSALLLIQQVIERWIKSAPPGEQKGLREFWGAVQWQFLTQPQLWNKLPISPINPAKS